MTPHERWSTGVPLTVAEARAAGYAVERGAYSGTSDDRSDRWYIARTAAGPTNRRGQGYTTRNDALWALTERLAADEAMVSQIDLVSVAEIAQRLGRTPGAVHALRQRQPGFPEPVARLASGPVWMWSDVAHWTAIPRPSGRPRKS